MTTCKDRLAAYLTDNHIPFQTMKHHTAYTAQEIAAEEKVPGQLFAKVVIVQADGKMVMVVMPATFRIDFRKLATAIGCRDVRLAKEPEFANLFPDCDTGAMPPFGNLYNLPVYVDSALARDREIVFNVGTHNDTMRMLFADYQRLVQPIIADIATHV